MSQGQEVLLAAAREPVLTGDQVMEGADDSPSDNPDVTAMDVDHNNAQGAAAETTAPATN